MSNNVSRAGEPSIGGVGEGKIAVAVVGPTGYTGLELLELLSRHQSLRVAYLATARETQPRIDDEFPRLAGRLGGGVDPQCRAIDPDAMLKAGVRLAFLCLPHEAAMTHAPALLARGIKVVDLSAAYRLRDAKAYERAYGHRHHDATSLSNAVYGLPEFNRDQITKANLVANPGCYPTAAAIALLPLLRAGLISPDSIIVNAASGASGAGREAKPHLTLVEAGDNFSAYGVGVHRHQPEIQQTLDVLGGRVKSPAAEGVLFVPHLLPIERGILATIYCTTNGPALRTADLLGELRDAYESEPFVRVRGEDAPLPTLRDVQRTNQVHVTVRSFGERVVLVAVIDNLVKGASGQAVQNANVMLGLPETAGLS